MGGSGLASVRPWLRGPTRVGRVMATTDVIVVGAGLAGLRCAADLTAAGRDVTVLEAGQRFDESTYPTTSWQLRQFVWAPALRCFGMQRISLLRNVMVLAGAGVGGAGMGGAAESAAASAADGWVMAEIAPGVRRWGGLGRIHGVNECSFIGSW